MSKSKEWPGSKVPRLTKGKKTGNRMGRRRNTDKTIGYRKELERMDGRALWIG